MLVIIGFMIVCIAAVGFFELLEYFDPSRGRIGPEERRHAARIDALERAVFDRDAEMNANRPHGGTI